MSERPDSELPTQGRGALMRAFTSIALCLTVGWAIAQAQLA